MSWYFKVLRKYADFSGRARRMEFWMFVLFNLLIGIFLGVIDALVLAPILGSGVVLFGLSTLYSIAVLLPVIAVEVRRLHDINFSGWWVAPFWVGWFVQQGYEYYNYFTMEDPTSVEESLNALTAGQMAASAVVMLSGLLLLVLFCIRGTRGENRYGSDPLKREVPDDDVWPDLE